MNKRIFALLLLAALMALGLLAACGDTGTTAAPSRSMPAEDTLQLIEEEPTEEPLQLIEDSAEEQEEPPALAESDAEEPASISEAEIEEETAAIDEDGEYTAPEDVALYLHTYGHLPGNFITKNKARDLGWDSSRGNLWDVAPGKSIGGDRFGNYEGLLPDTTKYRECDVNYDGGYRGAERIIYGEDGSIYYTNDHYNSFTKLY